MHFFETLESGVKNKWTRLLLLSQQTKAWTNSTIETLEKDKKYAQS